MLIIVGVRSCKKLQLSSMYGKLNKDMEVGEMARYISKGTGKFKERRTSNLEQLRQRKAEILKMLLHEGNNNTRGIYKTQLLHLDIAIEKAEAEK